MVESSKNLYDVSFEMKKNFTPSELAGTLPTFIQANLI
jgi:hypothetical protein